jgi:hypothetical protein
MGDILYKNKPKGHSNGIFDRRAQRNTLTQPDWVSVVIDTPSSVPHLKVSR